MFGIVDSYSRRGHVYSVGAKADFLACFRKFIADLGQPQCFREDKAGELSAGASWLSVMITVYSASISRPISPAKHPCREFLWRALKGGHSDTARMFPSGGNEAPRPSFSVTFDGSNSSDLQAHQPLFFEGESWHSFLRMKRS